MADALTLFRHDSAEPSCANLYLWPVLEREVKALGLLAGTRVFDLGCGNGTIAELLHQPLDGEAGAGRS